MRETKGGIASSRGEAKRETIKHGEANRRRSSEEKKLFWRKGPKLR